MQAYGSAGFSGAYGAAYGAAYGNSNMGFADFGKRGTRRMNIVSMALALLVPWVVFCLNFAMLSFDMHYLNPDLCRTLTIIQVVVMGLLVLLALGLSVRSRFLVRVADGTNQDPSWLLFIAVSALFAVAAAMYCGNRNFKVNTQVYFDIQALNTYQGVDVAQMRGQELMDAGRINFVEGTHIDLSRSMAFKNQETYCVAPITISGASVVGSPPLASYDFWAVGKGCCGAPASGQVDFKCGAYDNPAAKGGFRALSNQDRAFYRLAVQQAQSTYAIRAVHPLFFHWVADPEAEAVSYLSGAHQVLLGGMFVFFGFQMLLVYMASNAFKMCLGS